MFKQPSFAEIKNLPMPAIAENGEQQMFVAPTVQNLKKMTTNKKQGTKTALICLRAVSLMSRSSFLNMISNPFG